MTNGIMSNEDLQRHNIETEDQIVMFRLRNGPELNGNWISITAEWRNELGIVHVEVPCTISPEQADKISELLKANPQFIGELERFQLHIEAKNLVETKDFIMEWEERKKYVDEKMRHLVEGLRSLGITEATVFFGCYLSDENDDLHWVTIEKSDAMAELRLKC